MEHLVIKPTFACTANCPTCASRRSLHRELRGRDLLELDDWKNLFSEAAALGARHLTISGGEPTLYPQLAELIRAGKQHGWLVRLNSNGSFDGETIADELLETGLDVVDISLYHPVPARHDSMRGSNGLWQKATRNIELLAQLQKKHRGFKVITQTILCRENYSDFADLLELHRQLGSAGLLVSYLEGAFSDSHRLSPSQVDEFRRDVLPRAVDICGKLERFTRSVAVSSMQKLFSPELRSSEQWADGIYRTGEQTCCIPHKQALVLANGDVHPCNIVEYTHDPIAGNLLNQSFTDMWYGPKWDHFRTHPYKHCPRCPMAHHVFIPLRPACKLKAIIKAAMHKLHIEHLERFLLCPLRNRNPAADWRDAATGKQEFCSVGDDDAHA